ncbi:MAG: hypothetical protein ACJA2W_000448 [Planctomycetota bacterium]|jgi:hypothetical protein
MNGRLFLSALVLAAALGTGWYAFFSQGPGVESGMAQSEAEGALEMTALAPGRFEFSASGNYDLAIVGNHVLQAGDEEAVSTAALATPLDRPLKETSTDAATAVAAGHPDALNLPAPHTAA